MVNKTEKELEKDVLRLHNMFNNIELKFNCFDGNVYKMLNSLPEAEGLMIFFERGENFQSKNRIVFVGETNNFYKRIKAYYTSHAKFVSHIRDALGNRLGKPVLQKDANEYIQKNMSFVLIPVSGKGERLSLNKKILSTLSYCKDFKVSENWLGFSAPKEYEMIILSRLWAVKYPFGSEVMEENDLVRLE